MELSDIIAQIEKTAPLRLAASWDASGMQVAATRQTATHLALVLDPTPTLVGAAIAAGADMILAHHPLGLKPRLPSVLDEYHAVLRLLFTHDIPLYSAHTSLDTNVRGPAGWLADAFGLCNRQTLEPVEESSDGAPHPGYGLVGDLPEPMSYEAFTAALAARLGKGMWRASGPAAQTVSRLAYCPGSGEGLIRAAAAARADVYITGDIKYHAALEAPIRVLDVGHFILEETMMRAFADCLRGACAPVAVTFIASTDPFVFEGRA